MKKNKQLTKQLINSIVIDKRPRSQDSGRKYISECSSQSAETTLVSAIVGCVRDRELTTALEKLEKRGFSGDLAVFIVGNLQKMEVAE